MQFEFYTKFTKNVLNLSRNVRICEIWRFDCDTNWPFESVSELSWAVVSSAGSVAVDWHDNLFRAMS